MKVLVPYDGAELAEQAAVMAIELLAQHRIELILLRVIGDPRQEKSAVASLETAAERLATSPSTVSPVLAIGRTEEEIVRCADQHGADLIAMSTHGRPMLARMLVGSVTDRVIRTSPVPVLAIHPPTMSSDRISPPAGRRLRILAPLDGSRFAEEAVTMAIGLLRPSLIDLTVAAIQSNTALEVGIDDVPVREYLDRAASRLRGHDVPVSEMLDFGDPAQQIGRIAVEGGFDLVVMSTHGRGTLSRMLLGSVTDRVVRTSEIPVLVIQPHSMEIPYDPVSGEDVDPEKAEYTAEYHGRSFSFTSFEHRQQFESDPEAYIGRRSARVGLIASPYEGMARDPSYLPPPVPEKITS
jgi:nucleotide-binding universal stress UspA family protein/YHS domain-containing protein